MRKRVPTIGVNGFRLRSELPCDHPVYHAVETELRVSDNSTGHVHRVDILDRYEECPDSIIPGELICEGGGVSSVIINARCFDRQGRNLERGVRALVRHELSHAHDEFRGAAGLFLDGPVNRDKLEEKAKRAERKDR